MTNIVNTTEIKQEFNRLIDVAYDKGRIAGYNQALEEYANKLLSDDEYANKQSSDVVQFKKFAEWLNNRYGIIIPSSFEGDNGYRTITPKELVEQYKLFPNI